MKAEGVLVSLDFGGTVLWHAVAALLCCDSRAALYGGTLGAALGGQLCAVLVWCVVILVPSLGCVCEPRWWAVPPVLSTGEKSSSCPVWWGRMDRWQGTVVQPHRWAGDSDPWVPWSQSQRGSGRVPAPAVPAPRLSSSPATCALPVPRRCHCVPGLVERRRRRQAGEGWREEHSSDASCSQLQPSREPNLASPFLFLRRPRLPAVEDARSIACPRGVLTAGTPPGAGWRPAGPEPVWPGQRGSAEA